MVYQNRVFYLYLITILFFSCIGISVFLYKNVMDMNKILILMCWIASQVAVLILLYLTQECYKNQCVKYLNIIDPCYIQYVMAFFLILSQLLSVLWICEYTCEENTYLLGFLSALLICLGIIVSSSSFSYYARIAGLVYSVLWVTLFTIVIYFQEVNQ